MLTYYSENPFNYNERYNQQVHIQIGKFTVSWTVYLYIHLLVESLLNHLKSSLGMKRINVQSNDAELKQFASADDRKHTWSSKFTCYNKVCWCNITRDLTPQGMVLLQNISLSLPIKKFPTFYGTYRFTTVFAEAHDLPLPWARWIQSTKSHPISLRAI